MAKKKAARKRSGGEGEGSAHDAKGGDTSTGAASPDSSGSDRVVRVPEGEASRPAGSKRDGADADDAGATEPSPVVAREEVVAIKIQSTVHHERKAWGEPLAKVARGFDWFETRLLAAVLFGLVFALVAWVSLVGLAAPLESDSKAGGVFRGIVGAIVLGGVSRLVGKKLGWSDNAKAGLTAAAIVVAIVVAPMWRKAGVEYFGHIQNWLQEGSSLAMLGGLRGVGTRITVLLALLGGSLAAASGKHINIDVVMRFTPDRLKLPIFGAATMATVAVLLGAAWGFVDYIAIESFNYRPAQLQIHEKGEKYAESTATEELAFVQSRVGQHLFLFRKQVVLDLGAMGHVLGGKRWDDPERMNGHQWNALLDDGWAEKFTREEVDAIRSVPDQLDESRVPLVVVPGGGSARNLLIPSMNLMFPIGFVIIAFRFFLRLLLVISGHERLEDDAAPPKPDAAPEVEPRAAKATGEAA